MTHLRESERRDGDEGGQSEGPGKESTRQILNITHFSFIAYYTDVVRLKINIV